METGNSILRRENDISKGEIESLALVVKRKDKFAFCGSHNLTCTAFPFVLQIGTFMC